MLSMKFRLLIKKKESGHVFREVAKRKAIHLDGDRGSNF